MPRNPLFSDREGLLYEAVARRLAAGIQSGKVGPGERLPSVRALARQYRVSLSTAVQAYRHLENQRLVEARPQSGFFVVSAPLALPEPAPSRPSPARFVVPHPIVVEYQAALADPALVPLGTLQSDPALFPTRKLASLLGSIARGAPELAGRYGPPKGEPSLIRAIARRGLANGCDLAVDEIVITAGGVEALHLGLRAVAKAGDTIALESPTYFVMLQMIESLGMKALEIPTHPRTGISLEALELATRKRGAVRAIMVTPSFANPLGSVMPDESRKGLVQMCEERAIPLIEDDVYGDIWFSGARPLPAKAWDRAGNVLSCSSFSKTLAPGLRVGWIAAGRFRDQVLALKRVQTIFTPPLPQLTVAAYLDSGGYEHQLRRVRRDLGDRARRVASLVAQSFPEGTRLAPPAGGYVLWVEMPAGVDAVTLFRRARDAGILLAPGPVFSNTGRFKSAVRFSFGMAVTSTVERAVARVGRMAAEMA